jgi:hypothetical protein
MTFTDDFVVSAWIKLTSYNGAPNCIASRYDGTSGWTFDLDQYGRVQLTGFNAGAGNNNYVLSKASIPLGKWVHVAAQLDMSAFAVGATNSYIMIDGTDVPAEVIRNGSNPTQLIQAGSLNVGARNGALFFNGKLAQVAIYNAKVTQATIRASISQTLTGSETSLVSAYSLSGSKNDLSANANNLTANGSAVETNADSPYAQGATAGSLEHAIIVTAPAFSTNTTVVVQVPEGSALPTTGGISAVSYSSHEVPFGFPRQVGKWHVECLKIVQSSQAAGAGTIYNLGSLKLTTPIGEGTLNCIIGTWSSAACTLLMTLSTSSSTLGSEASTGFRCTNAAGAFHGHLILNDVALSNSSATDWYYTVQSTSTPTINVGAEGLARIWWKPAYV